MALKCPNCSGLGEIGKNKIGCPSCAGLGVLIIDNCTGKITFPEVLVEKDQNV